MLVSEDAGGEIDVGAGRCHIMQAVEMLRTRVRFNDVRCFSGLCNFDEHVLCGVMFTGKRGCRRMGYHRTRYARVDSGALASRDAHRPS